jgi:hypothetical protein
MTPCSESCTYERDASPAFVFDLMEPEQPKVDRAILSFLKSDGIASGGFHDQRGWGREAQSGAGEEGGKPQCFQLSLGCQRLG